MTTKQSKPFLKLGAEFSRKLVIDPAEPVRTGRLTIGSLLHCATNVSSNLQVFQNFEVVSNKPRGFASILSYVVLRSNARAFGDIPQNFELRSNDPDLQTFTPHNLVP
ncbi:hypothetical protein TNCV_1859121 [Trichonephila clavipes]|nr:hypothetical protein TNCV_1859121 [Trichonephila clavipes]